MGGPGDPQVAGVGVYTIEYVVYIRTLGKGQCLRKSKRNECTGNCKPGILMPGWVPHRGVGGGPIQPRLSNNNTQGRISVDALFYWVFSDNVSYRYRSMGRANPSFTGKKAEKRWELEERGRMPIFRKDAVSQSLPDYAVGLPQATHPLGPALERLQDIPS